MEIVQKLRSKIIGSGDEHSQNRNKNIVKTVGATVLARFINVATGLVTVPIALNYLGVQGFGIWMTVTSFVAFLGFTDLGLGVGLQNALSKCHGEEDLESPRSCISTAYALMVVASVFLVLFAFLAIPLMPVSQLVKVESSGESEVLLPLIQGVVVIFALGLPLGLIQQVLIGYQQGYMAGLLLLVGRILAFGCVMGGVWFKQSILFLVYSFVGIPFVVMLLYSLYYFYTKKPHRPSIQCVSIGKVKHLANAGIWIFLAQLSFSAKMNVPIFIISSSIGVLAVSQFTITQKLLGLSTMMISMALHPLWPAYGEAYHRGDKQWVCYTYFRSLKAVLLVSIPFFFAIAFFGRWIIQLWVNDPAVVPAQSLLLACNVWMVLIGLNIACAMLLNGIHRLMGQGTYGLACTVVGCLVAIYYGIPLGAAAVIWCIVCFSEIPRLLLMAMEVRYVIRKMQI
jgi:O-antigen/teichoic acid export membrane protein